MADEKEEPGDRNGSPYSAIRLQELGYDGGTAQPVYDVEAT